jgi:hypothetical protein
MKALAALAVLAMLSGCDNSSNNGGGNNDSGTNHDAGTGSDAGQDAGPPDGGYTIGGFFTFYYSTLSGGQLVLATPGQPNLVNPPNPFHFANPVPTGTAYQVTIVEEPTNNNCSIIDGGTGVVGTDNVISIDVSCAIQLP